MDQETIDILKRIERNTERTRKNLATIKSIMIIGLILSILAGLISVMMAVDFFNLMQSGPHFKHLIMSP